eukprot:m.69772 g.69772  ORF g.69772 m.69772 type:complete len:63 (+) comp13750_c0_seq6:59-247(+)
MQYGCVRKTKKTSSTKQISTVAIYRRSAKAPCPHLTQTAKLHIVENDGFRLKVTQHPCEPGG